MQSKIQAEVIEQIIRDSDKGLVRKQTPPPQKKDHTLTGKNTRKRLVSETQGTRQTGKECRETGAYTQGGQLITGIAH